MPNWSLKAVQHTAISTTDLQRSLSFYKDTLGLTELWQSESSGERLSMLNRLQGAHAKIAAVSAGSQIIEIFQFLAPPAENKVTRPCDTGIIHIGLAVTDLQEAFEELSRKGVQFNCPPVYVSDGPMKGWTVTYFRDPDGITLELMQAPAQ